MNAPLPRALAIGLLMLLAACGGGGGSAAGGGGGPTGPTISAQPANLTVADGATASFTVTAMGTAPLSYQWQRKGVDITGATSATYSFVTTYPADNGASFKVRVANSAGGVTSASATLAVTPIAPLITTQPMDASVGDGVSADFTAMASGSASLAYQWQSAQAGSPGIFADITGATGSSYRLWVAQQGNNGSKFRVVVTNDAGSATSTAATLTVSPAAPSIRTQPRDLTVLAGTDATFTVEAYGTAPMHFQWSRVGTGNVGTDGASYTVFGATVLGDNNAQFNVVVSNLLGPVTSNTVTLHVSAVEVAPSTVTVSPPGTFTVGEGAPVAFVATVDSSATAVNYQWRKNGADLAGEVGDHLNISQATAPMDGDTYSVRVFNSAGAPITSAVSTLRVTPGNLTLLAGHVGGVGNVDGSGATAQFSSPAGVAMDSAGNTYVADSGNHTIRKITSTGVVSTIAGQPGTRGRTDGAGTSVATFSIPRGVAVDDLGNIYVADQANNAIRRIDTFGNVLTIAGSGVSGSSNSATGTLATFNRPVGVAVIGTMLYVVDAGNNRIRQVDLTPLGTFSVTDLSGSVAGAINGALVTATYNNPTGISADVPGQVLYVADAGNALVRKLDLNPVGGAVTTLAGRAGVTAGLDGNLATASFRSADGLAYSAAASAVFVSDATSHTIRKVDLAVLDTDPLFVTTFAGSPGNAGVGGGVGTLARFNGPQGIAVTQAGDRMVVADNTSNLVDQITVSTQLVANLAGSSVARGYANGKAADSLFNVPTALLFDGNQKLYIADSANHVIRMIDLAKPQTDAGYVSLYAGGPGLTGTTNGALTAARFNNPRALALGAGALYVAEVGNNSIRKIDMALGQVTKVPDPGALLNDPSGVAVDATDKIYVASTFNHNIYLMSGGTVTLIAGNGLPGPTNGNGAAAQFSSPVGLALDEANHLLYVADRGNCAIRVIDVSTTNYVVSTLAGGVGCGFNDTGASPAQFALPLQIALDGTATAGQRGGIYVTDLANHALRKVSSAGVVSTVVGSPARIGAQLGSSDPGSSGLNAPYGVSVDATNGRLYLSDDEEHAIMRVSPLP